MSYRPKTTPADKIKFKYTKPDSDQPFAKILPRATRVSELPVLCLKIEEDQISHYVIYIDDNLINDGDKEIGCFSQNFTVRFEKKTGVKSTFFTIDNLAGESIEYFDDDTEFLKKLNIDIKIDSYIIFDVEGNEVNITDENYQKVVKNDSKFYLIKFPIKLKNHSEIPIFLKIEIPEFPKLLCIFYKLLKDKSLSNKYNKYFHGKCFPLKSIFDSFFKLDKIELENENFLYFILALPFLKEDKKSFIEVFEEPYKKNRDKYPFKIYDSKYFLYGAKVEEDSILNVNNEKYGIYKGLMNSSVFKYYDPYEGKEFQSSIDFSNISDPNQITGIFVDTSGSMMQAFGNTGKAIYEIAVDLANEISSKIREMNIYDPIIISTSSVDKVDANHIPLQIASNDVGGKEKSNIWDKIDALSEKIIEIKSKKATSECPCHIIIITDGEDSSSSKSQVEVLKKLKNNGIIIDSIILQDNEYSQQPSIFSKYTNGVFLYPDSTKKKENPNIDDSKSNMLEKFGLVEPFYNLDVRNKVSHLIINKNPFNPEDKKLHRLKLLKQLYKSNNEFYCMDSYPNGLLKPSIEKYKDLHLDNENLAIILKELNECLEAESTSTNFYIFLDRNDDKYKDKVSDDDKRKHKDRDDGYSDDDHSDDGHSDDDHDGHSDDDDGKHDDGKDKTRPKDHMLKHWCIFIQLGDKDSYFWQMKVDFDSNYPKSLPRMRIISRPELIDASFISHFGTINIKEFIPQDGNHYSILKILEKLTLKKVEIKEYEGEEQDPVSVIDENLSDIISVEFEDGWRNDETDAFDKRISKRDFK